MCSGPNRRDYSEGNFIVELVGGAGFGEGLASDELGFVTSRPVDLGYDPDPAAARAGPWRRL